VTPNEALQKLITAAGNPDGLLPPDRARQFMTWVMDESVLRGNSRIYPMSSNTYEAPYLLLGDIFEEGTEATSPSSEGNVDTGLIPIIAKEIVGKTFISDTFIEDNIETAGFFVTLAQEIAKAYANKEDDIFFNSTSTGTGLYGLWDGLVAKATASSHRKDLTGDTIDLGYMSDAIKLLPQKWTRNRKNLRFYSGQGIAQDICELLSQRPTPLGDQTVTSGTLVTIYGVPLISATAMAENKVDVSGGTSDHGDVILTPVNNTLIGDRRIYRIERERRPRQRGTWMVPSSRVGFNVETVDAISDLYNVKVAP
jgi:HK97 family phage major capsid protein